MTEAEVRAALRAAQFALAETTTEAERQRLAHQVGALAVELGRLQLRAARQNVPEAFHRAFEGGTAR